MLNAKFNFFGLLFSSLKRIYNTCAIHAQVNKQASVARILFAGFFGIFSTSINKKLLEAQIKAARRAARLESSTVLFRTNPTSKATLRSYYFLIYLPTPKNHILIIHQAWIQTLISTTTVYNRISFLSNRDTFSL